MKPRYNLRIQPTKLLLSTTTNRKTSSRVTKTRHSNPLIKQQNRRHSLRLKSTTKPPITNSRKATFLVPKWRNIENDTSDENSSLNNDTDDDYDDLLARHNRYMLEEQKDRKLYERYVRDQRILRRLQCRRSHTAHLNERKRTRLLRELERERRYTIQDKICAYLADHRFIFRHKCNIESNQAMNWSTLEEEVPGNRNIGTIHELDVMIDNLKKAVQNSKTPIPKPRLSIHERQKKRSIPITPNKSDFKHINSSPPTLNIPSQLSIISHSPRIPVVRFIDDQNSKIRASNSQRLTCIQNVLSHQSNRIATNDISTLPAIRKSFLRPKSSPVNLSDLPPTKKRPLEKENCSNFSNSTNHTNNNVDLRTTSPMVSIKYTPSSSSSRSYPNTRKHSVNHNSLTTRRQTRLSTNA